MNPPTHLVVRIAQLLQEKKWRMATAESCTGGMVSAALTDLAGSSLWFERAYITYSNEAKQEDLGVPSELIVKHGAVSEEVAQAMAKGLLTKQNVDIGLSITGVAGPSGGSAEKPVGLVCFAWAWYHSKTLVIKTETKRFVKEDTPTNEKTRHLVRALARDFALERLTEILENPTNF